MFAYDLLKACDILVEGALLEEVRSGALGRSSRASCYSLSQTMMQRDTEHHLSNRILRKKLSASEVLTTLVTEGSVITLRTLSILFTDHGLAFKSSKRFRILRIEGIAESEMR